MKETTNSYNCLRTYSLSYNATVKQFEAFSLGLKTLTSDQLRLDTNYHSITDNLINIQDMTNNIKNHFNEIHTLSQKLNIFIHKDMNLLKIDNQDRDDLMMIGYGNNLKNTNNHIISNNKINYQSGSFNINKDFMTKFEGTHNLSGSIGGLSNGPGRSILKLCNNETGYNQKSFLRKSLQQEGLLNISLEKPHTRQDTSRDKNMVKQSPGVVNERSFTSCRDTERKPGAGRKIANPELESYVLHWVERKILEKGCKPSRKEVMDHAKTF